MKAGEFLMMMIFFSGMSQREFAEKINISAPVSNDIVKGKRGINIKYAKLFEAGLGIPAIVWLTYQNHDELTNLKK